MILRCYVSIIGYILKPKITKTYDDDGDFSIPRMTTTQRYLLMNDLIVDSRLFFNKSPICPHCKQERKNTCELELNGHGDTTVIECDWCSKRYQIELDITYSTSKPNT